MAHRATSGDHIQSVERYLDLLEQTSVIFRLPSFSTNARKEIVKIQKVFFWDAGIPNALLVAPSGTPMASKLN